MGILHQSCARIINFYAYDFIVFIEPECCVLMALPRYDDKEHIHISLSRTLIKVIVWREVRETNSTSVDERRVHTEENVSYSCIASSAVMTRSRRAVFTLCSNGGAQKKQYGNKNNRSQPELKAHTFPLMGKWIRKRLIVLTPTTPYRGRYLIVLSVKASSPLPNLRFSLPSPLHGEGKTSAASRGEDEKVDFTDGY